MPDQLHQVELTVSFLDRLYAIEAFLTEANAAFAFDALLAEIRATVIPNLRRFPRMGRPYLANRAWSRKRVDFKAEAPVPRGIHT